MTTPIYPDPITSQAEGHLSSAWRTDRRDGISTYQPSPNSYYYDPHHHGSQVLPCRSRSILSCFSPGHRLHKQLSSGSTHAPSPTSSPPLREVVGIVTFCQTHIRDLLLACQLARRDLSQACDPPSRTSSQDTAMINPAGIRSWPMAFAILVTAFDPNPYPVPL